MLSVVMQNFVMLSVITEWLYGECRYAECRYAESRYAECCGAIFSPAYFYFIQYPSKLEC
jgi:hypothetical protein